jgi:predicted ATPase
MLDNFDLYIRSLSIDWGMIYKNSYLRKISSIASLDELVFHNAVTFFVGENGSGKSTILEAIAVGYGFNPEGGTKNYNFSTFDSHSELCDALTLSKGYKKANWGYFLRAESFYNVATAEEEYSRGAGGIPQHFHEHSHGESFLQLAQTNFKPNGLYILDEPEAALSPQRQLTLLLEIARCVKEGSQFIIATHSPILLGFPDAEILNFDDELRPCRYEDTESYIITKMFVNDRGRVLRQLMENDEVE